MQDIYAIRKRLEKEVEAMDDEYNLYLPEWQDNSDFVWGARGRFMKSNNVSQRARNPRLYNEAAKLFLQVMTSGMSAGITSSSRPWFKTGFEDKHLTEFGPVKQWLMQVERVMYAMFARSNFYNVMNGMYAEMGLFGQQPIMILEDFRTGVRFEPYTCGEYRLSVNSKHSVDRLVRKFEMTVNNMEQMFAKERLSVQARNMLKNGNGHKKRDIVHVVEPNEGFVLDSPSSQKMDYMSFYYEEGSPNEEYLRKSGFREKPFVAPRWDALPGDVYAAAYPSVNSIGTNKSLQVDELDKSIAQEKMHNPALIADASLRNGGASMTPGEITYVAGLMQAQRPGVQSVYDTNPRIDELINGIIAKEERLSKHFFADLFMMIASIQRTHVSAQEIAGKQEEKLLMLGPVLGRLDYEAFDPIIDRVFNIGQEKGLFPPPPPEIEGKAIKIEYISMLAQAQRAIGNSGIDSTVAFVQNISQTWPEARHKLNIMQAVDEFADTRGAPPSILNDDKTASERYAAEVQQQQQAQAMEAAQSAAGTAKDLAGADMSGDNALNRMMGG